jgi:hypothetical protein
VKRILVDRHHAALLYSLQLLFEGRLGMELYVPVGMEWWEQGYWRFGEAWGDDRLARQFLAANPPWTRDGSDYTERDFGWYCFDADYPHRLVRGIQLDEFRELGDWKVVMATVQENQAGFHRLAGECGAASAYQVGNARQWVEWGLDQRFLVSTSQELPAGVSGVQYRQEFEKDTVFAAANRPLGTLPTSAASFVNLLERLPEQWDRFARAEALLPSWKFRTHGHDSRDGFVQPASDVAARMAEVGFAWHDKPSGDGFGHVLHSWAAIGRPIIGTYAYYDGQLARPLLEDGVTGFDLGARSIEETVKLMEVAGLGELPDWYGYGSMCREIRRRLDASCDFAGDAERIRVLLEL